MNQIAVLSALHQKVGLGLNINGIKSRVRIAFIFYFQQLPPELWHKKGNAETSPLKSN
jgi:hypothetical protein